MLDAGSDISERALRPRQPAKRQFALGNLPKRRVAHSFDTPCWEIDQGTLTSTRTLPEISAFAAIANASLTSSKDST